MYPWQAQGGDNNEELKEGSASGNGSGEMEPLYPDTEECKKYKQRGCRKNKLSNGYLDQHRYLVAICNIKLLRRA